MLETLRPAQNVLERGRRKRKCRGVRGGYAAVQQATENEVEGHFQGHERRDVQKGQRQGRSERGFEAYSTWYVENPSDARTPPLDFFNIPQKPKWWNGRHARLRGVWRKPCGFKSRLRHQHIP